MFLVAVIVAAIAGQRAALAARERDEVAVLSAAARLESALASDLSALRGADVLVRDGELSEDDFATFARDVIIESSYRAIAYAEIVPGAGRAQWERDNGSAIRDTDGRGGLDVAPTRDPYVPVRFVYPPTESARSVIGFDITSDPVRSRGVTEASASDNPVLVGPIALALGGANGLFAIHSVDDAAGQTVGFLASGIDPQQVATVVAPASGAPAPTIGLWIDGDGLSGVDATGPDASFQVGSRVITVRTHDGRGIDWNLTIGVGATAIALLVAALMSLHRDRSEQRRRRRRAHRSLTLGVLADELAGAASVDDTIRLTLQRVHDIVNADHVSIGVVDAADASVMAITDDQWNGTTSPGDRSLVLSEEDWPMSRCALAANEITVTQNGSTDREVVRLHASSEPAHAIVCEPLTIGRDEVFGVVGFAWSETVTAEDLAEHRASAALVAQVVGRALERSFTRETARDRAEQLSDFAGSLAAAQTPDEMNEVVGRSCRPSSESAGSHSSTPTLSTRRPPARIRCRRILPVRICGSGATIRAYGT